MRWFAQNSSPLIKSSDIANSAILRARKANLIRFIAENFLNE